MEEVEILDNTEDSCPDNSDKNDSIDAYIFVLFDGTNNNMYNIAEYKSLEGKREKKDLDKLFKKLNKKSALEEYSNVARLYQICKVEDSSNIWVSSVYVDGIGTSTLSDSVLAGQGLGVGDLGVEAKVQKGCELVVQCLNDFAEKLTKESEVTLHIAATGFSRGATAARRFISCLKERQGGDSPYQVCLRDHLESLDSVIVLQEEFDVPILGLFDTVSSYGVGKTLKSTAKFLSKETLQRYADNVEELSLNKLDDATCVFQICAADEYRMHFALTKVKGDENNYIIPGCHSDIGGGYVDDKEEEYTAKIVKKLFSLVSIDNFVRLGNGNKTQKELLEEGWFTEDDIKKGNRKVSLKYSFIPYLYMLNVFKTNLPSVKDKLFDEAIRRDFQYGTEAWKNDTSLPDDQMSVLDEFYGLVMGNTKFYSFPNMSEYKLSNIESLRLLRNKFLHLSSQFNLTNLASPDNKRIIIEG